MNDDLIARAKAAIEDHTWHDGEKLFDLVVDLVARCERAEAERDNAEHLALAERKVASDGAIAVNILRAKCDVLSTRCERAEADADRLREAIRRVQARGMYLGLDMDIALTLSDEAVAQR